MPGSHLAKPKPFSGDTGNCVLLVSVWAPLWGAGVLLPHWKVQGSITHLSGSVEAWAMPEWAWDTPVRYSLNLFRDMHHRSPLAISSASSSNYLRLQPLLLSGGVQPGRRSQTHPQGVTALSTWGVVQLLFPVELNNLLSILLPTSHSNSAGYPMTNSLPSGVGGLRHRLELYG